MKEKIKTIITKLRGIEDDLIDLLADYPTTGQAKSVNEVTSESEDKTITGLLDLLDGQMNRSGGYNGEASLKDSFHELSGPLAKANGIDISDARKHIRYSAEPTPIVFNKLGRIKETEVTILDDEKIDDEKIDAGSDLDPNDLKAIPHVPQVDDLLAALKVKDHPDWFKQQKADEEARRKARRKPHDPVPFLPETIEAVAPLTPEEIEQQITKVTHLKEIANQYAMMPKQGLGPNTVLQKIKVKHLKSKCDAEAPKPAKPVTRVMDKIPSTKNA